ncbi:MAG: hypothetical protein WD382_11530 [Halofilum sp. (in: g-proteobacteria)]
MVSSGDLDDAASDALAEAIQLIVDGEDVEPPVTLASVRHALSHASQARSAPLRRLDPEDREALGVELEDLIAVYGEEAAAERFLQPFGGSDLTRVLEHAIERGDEPTLGQVQGMIEQGLLAELIGEGEVAEEDEQGIRASLEALISRHGANAFAEDFLGSA